MPACARGGLQIDVLQHLAVERQVGYDLLQPAVLVLQLLQRLHLVRQQPGPRRIRVISDEGCCESRMAEKEAVMKSAIMRLDAHVEEHLIETSPLPKSSP